MIYGTLSYICSEGKVAMIRKFADRQEPNSGLYTLPGGKMDEIEARSREGRLESAIREVEEEAGISMIDPIPRGEIFFNNEGRIFDNWKNSKDYYVYVFSASEYEGDLKKEDREGILEWIPKEEIPSLPKNEGDKKIYEWLESERYFRGTIKHEGKEIDEDGTTVEYLWRVF